MSGRALLYGASGYTGRAIAAHLAGSTDLVLAGRNEARLRAVAEPLGLPWRVCELADGANLRAALNDIDVVLHSAGPFADTARPMIEACIGSRTHYLDLAGEWPVFLMAQEFDAAARKAGVMVLPGAGLTVAVSDCLLAEAVSRWPDTVRLCLGISRAQVISRGSMTTASRLIEASALVRREGALIRVPAGSLSRAFDFGTGLSDAVAASWADVVTGAFTTGVETIEVYSQTRWDERAATRIGAMAMSFSGPRPFQAAAGVFAGVLPEGPDDAKREAARFVMVAEALDRWRRVRRLRWVARDGYGASVLTAAEALRRVLAGITPAGFQTPARAFGATFAIDAGAAAYLPEAARTAA